jgi:hypothetical protein
MCTHYATVFTQACASLGLIVRTQIMQNHCTAEIWSNEYRKWIFMDPGGDANDATKATYHFERHGVPMSALECHRAWVRQDFEGIQIVPESAARIFKAEDRLSLFERILITQRNDELTSLQPGEPEHGAMSYHYDRYVWWEDEQTMGLPHFSLHSSREGDFHWSVNKTRIYLHQSLEKDSLQVQLDTITPNLDSFQVKIDQEAWETKPDRFVWVLHLGYNRLEVRSINRFGRTGMTSYVALNRA